MIASLPTRRSFDLRWLAIDGRLGRRLRVRRWRVERLDLDQAVARRMMIRLSQRQRWIGETLLDGKAAARAKAAARGGVKQVRRCSIDRRKLGGAAAIEPRHCAQ